MTIASWWGGGIALSPQFCSQMFPKGPLFDIILHLFLADQPQNFSEGAFGANISNFEWKARTKKTHFASKFSKKCPKTDEIGSL